MEVSRSESDKEASPKPKPRSLAAVGCLWGHEHMGLGLVSVITCSWGKDMYVPLVAARNLHHGSHGGPLAGPGW